ncbi:MAG TPA: MarR family transcriptional regulator [Candidatus Saccharimonadales bacterium]|nr:MarR family transcriptional regulator [Candidatus Saccharimonadales bacterium]
MKKLENEDLKQHVIRGGREYGISTVLFRHTVGSAIGVNVTDMECLGLLFFKGISTPSELSEHTGLSSGATTAMLDRLQRAGLIQRNPNPQDRRGSLISIAPGSKKTIGPMFASVRAAQDELVSSFSPEELRVIDRYFTESVAMWESERRKLQNTIS